jgi:hypothetical protein
VEYVGVAMKHCMHREYVCSWKTLYIGANINPLVPGSFVYKLPLNMDNLTCNKQSLQCYVFIW